MPSRKSRNRPAQKSAAASTSPGRVRESGAGERGGRATGPAPEAGHAGRGRLIAFAALALVVAIGAGWAVATNEGNATSQSPSGGTLVQARGGSWTNITPDRLAPMLASKDFTLLNVKTPYIGEIEGTDLYIPYTDLAARAAELPADKAATIVVYCRSGNESAVAAQTLLDLGYTNVLNLDGGMNAWTASGRQLVQRSRA